MRIRLNGPSLRKFDSIKYSKYWLDEQLESRADDPVRKKSEKFNEIEESDLF